MQNTELARIAQAMVAPGRGILAADESSNTIKRRFDAIGVESTADTRRDYRQLLFQTSIEELQLEPWYRYRRYRRMQWSWQ